MITFGIDSEDRITVFDNKRAAAAGSIHFHSEKELQGATKDWPTVRLINAWNLIPGVSRVRKFINRQTGTARIWKALQNQAPAETVKQAPEPGQRSKKDEVIALLSRESGATLFQLIAATGWQKHSVCGFLSGTLKKKMGSSVCSEKNAAGERVYWIPGGSE